MATLHNEDQAWAKDIPARRYCRSAAAGDVIPSSRDVAGNMMTIPTMVFSEHVPG